MIYEMNQWTVLGLKHTEKRAFQCQRGHFAFPRTTQSDICRITIDEVGRFYIFSSNGIPDHDSQHNDGQIVSQNIKIAIPKNPVMLAVRN